MSRFLQILAVISLFTVTACANLPGGQRGDNQFAAAFGSAHVGVFAAR